MAARILGILAAAAVLFAGLAGCGSGDTDPGAKVDAPGYYNGPMQPRGQRGEGTAPETKPKDGQGQ